MYTKIKHICNHHFSYNITFEQYLSGEKEKKIKSELCPHCIARKKKEIQNNQLVNS